MQNKFSFFLLGLGCGLILATFFLVGGQGEKSEGGNSNLLRSTDLEERGVLPATTESEPEKQLGASTESVGADRKDETVAVVVSIPRRLNARQIAKLLVSKGVLREQTSFLELLYAQKKTDRLLAGIYHLRRGMKPEEVLELMSAPKY